jgi:DNA invertase Pin-like site-specific DNA recombinase
MHCLLLPNLKSRLIAELRPPPVTLFAAERRLDIVGTYAENESGAKLARPELFRLLADSKPATCCLSSKLIASRV